MTQEALNNLSKTIGPAPEATTKPFKEKPKIFVYREIDELGLDPYEFRVYSHVARRGNCFATLDKVAATCCMSVRRVQYALKVLEASGLIEKEARKGRTNKFSLAPPSRWLHVVTAETLKDIRQKVKHGEAVTTPAQEISAIAKPLPRRIAQNTGDFDIADLDAAESDEIPF
ncbi:MAG: helix-turn-helix domain-containing protein [Cyanobacteria bacterium J06634_5]